MSTTAPTGITGFKGRLTRPGDPGYEDTRAVYNAMIDRRPALIATCTDAADVASVIAFARTHGLPRRSAAAATTAPGSGPSTTASSSTSRG